MWSWTLWIDLKLIKLLNVSNTGLFLLLLYTDRCYLMYTKTSHHDKCKQYTFLQTTTSLCGATLAFFRLNIAVLIICLSLHIKRTWLGSRSLPGWKLSRHLVKNVMFCCRLHGLKTSYVWCFHTYKCWNTVSIRCHTATVLLTVWHHSQHVMWMWSETYCLNVCMKCTN